MDKYIKMLIIKLSEKYKVTLVHIISLNDESNRLRNLFKILIKSKDGKKLICEKNAYDKRGAVSELMKWVN